MLCSKSNDIYPRILARRDFSTNTIYFIDGVAYDFYSINELGCRTSPGSQWLTFPLPNERYQTDIIAWMPPGAARTSLTTVYLPTSPLTTGLAFVDRIYLVSISNLTDRHDNLRHIFAQYQITNFELRLKWTHSTCNAPENKAEVYKKLNLLSGSFGNDLQRQQCSFTMKHVDVWHDIVARDHSLALILEDNAIFVPFFREKFERTIYTAIRTGALRLDANTRCIKRTRWLSNKNEWIEQDPVIVIGSCFNIHDSAFPINQKDASPMLSTHKQNASRCAHAYLLTACSARALLRQITVHKNVFHSPHHLLNEQVAASPTLQSFWLDPPIVYRVEDLDSIP